MEFERGAEIDYDLASSMIKFLKEKNLLDEFLNKKSEIPLSIFNSNLGAYESICKYFSEQGLKNIEIARLTNRDSKSVWQAINKANKKHPQKLKTLSEYYLPKDILKSELSVLETIVVYLKENYGLSFTEIAKLMHRDPRTIWTTYRRSKR